MKGNISSNPCSTSSSVRVCHSRLLIAYNFLAACYRKPCRGCQSEITKDHGSHQNLNFGAFGLQVNDVIVDINGATEDTGMVAQCKSAMQLNVTFLHKEHRSLNSKTKAVVG